MSDKQLTEVAKQILEAKKLIPTADHHCRDVLHIPKERSMCSNDQYCIRGALLQAAPTRVCAYDSGDPWMLEACEADQACARAAMELYPDCYSTIKQPYYKWDPNKQAWYDGGENITHVIANNRYGWEAVMRIMDLAVQNELQGKKQ